MIRIKKGDEIWYYKILNDDYYGRPVSGISELQHSIVTNITQEIAYHDLELIHYQLYNGENVTNIGCNIYTNEHDAIINYNNSIKLQCRICDEHINKIIELKQELESKLIKEKAL